MNNDVRHRFLIAPANTCKVFGCAFAFLFIAIHLQAQSFPTRENQVKAVFLFNFTQFVEWPANAFSSSDAPFIIGIVGKDPFGDYIDQTVRGEKMMNHPLVVQRYKTVRDIRDCHILFIGADDMEKLKEVSSVLNRRSTLTVSDSNNFANAGGMIRFFTKENKTKLQINLSAVKAAELNISSKLLRVAEIIE